jgi:hypothetical protein
LKYQDLQAVSDKEEPGPFTVAGAVQGNIGSYYADHELPPGVDRQQPAEESGSDQQASASSRVLVVGNGTMYRPVKSLGYSGQMRALGGQFFISSIEWLVQDSALAQIRGKSMPKFTGKVEEGLKRQIQFVNIAVVPALFALLGILMVGRRRRRRERLRSVGDRARDKGELVGAKGSGSATSEAETPETPSDASAGESSESHSEADGDAKKGSDEETSEDESEESSGQRQEGDAGDDDTHK